MIHEFRTYTTPPGMAPLLAKHSSEIARPIRGDDYGKLEGYWLTEIGALNAVMHLWSYDDLIHRQERRDALAQNERWTGEYLPKILPIVLRQDIRLMAPVRPINPPTSGGNVYEYRAYRCKTGKANNFANLLRDYLPVREKYSQNVGLWTTIAGQPNEVSHLWVYESLNHRAEARAACSQDPEWKDFLRQGGQFLDEMSASVLLPSRTSPLQ